MQNSTDISRVRRLLGLLAAFTALVLASPGVLTDSGLWPLAVIAVALWARFASQPGRWAFGIEMFAAGLGWCGLMGWAALVHPVTLAFIGPGHGLYFAIQGWALRRFARRFPLAVATPLAWMLFETLRTTLEPPLGVSWMRLGTFAHDAFWMSGSARVWGTGGLTLVLAALGGGLADVWGARAGARKNASPFASAAFAMVPLVLAILFARLVPAPETVAGPRLLLVQPGFPQSRKMANDDRAMMFDQIELTRDGLASLERAGEPPPDLVAWAETMLRLSIFDPATAAAVAEGVGTDSWRRWRIDSQTVEEAARVERDWIDGLFFGADGRQPALLPEGTAFVAGAEYVRPVDGRLRFQNAVLLWPGSVAERRGPSSKLHLVPGAESMRGLERFEAVRNTIFSLAGYVPDFYGRLPGEDLLSFTARDGRTFRFGVAVCFDNAFDDAFLDPAREADVDFHMVFSNEAWFLRSHLVEQMTAFSRLAALSTGRSVVRATQSGASLVLAPDGRESVRLIDAAGEDEMATGSLLAVVPVPTGGSWTPFETDTTRAPRAKTPFVRTSLAWAALWMGCPALLLALGLGKKSAARA